MLNCMWGRKCEMLMIRTALQTCQVRVVCMQTYMHATSPFGHSMVGRSSWSGSAYPHEGDNVYDSRPEARRMKSVSCTGSQGGFDLYSLNSAALSVPPLSDDGAFNPFINPGSRSGSLSSRMPALTLHGHPQTCKSVTPTTFSPLTIDDSTPQEGSGSGVSDVSTCVVSEKCQEYTFWSGQHSMWSCEAASANSCPSSGQQPLSKFSPQDDDSDEYFGDEQGECSRDPLLSKLPADLLNVLATGPSIGQLADVTNNFGTSKQR
jgi:hypothetical protein